ncbi:MAG TPA: DUF523 domain-containing protein [Holophagaceae bacterium]|nr:DUF523 domain-containing protein [Holophagaceae bacterium]
MIRILVSACLLGDPVRFDGQAKTIRDPRWDRWAAEGRLVPLCPEVAGGLPVPRPPAERQADGRVRDDRGEDRTGEFERGAQHALAAAREAGCTLAILKEGSPSCGVRRIYDGTFSRTALPGEGLTTELLRRHGLAVFSEAELDQVERLLQA